MHTHQGSTRTASTTAWGPAPLQTIKDVKFNSSLLKNPWQSVLGYYRLGKRGPFLERCMQDLVLALDGATDEQFLACRRLLLKEIRALKEKGAGPARKKARQAVLQRPLAEAKRVWPRLVVPVGEREPFKDSSSELSALSSLTSFKTKCGAWRDERARE
jgi:hypothetical protein